MKKFVLAILAVSTIATANAQKGTILVYGNVGLHSMKDVAKTNYMSWNITPGVGYQFNNNWAAGLSLNYSVDSSMKADGASDRTSYSHYNIGAFLRYTKNINEIFAVYGQLDAGYMGGHGKVGSTEIPYSKWTGFGAMVTPAVAVNIPKWFAMSFSVGGLGYHTTKYDGAPNSENHLDFTFGQQVNIGIYKNFGGHHMHHKHMKDEDNDDSMAPAHHKHHHKSKKAKNDDDDDE